MEICDYGCGQEAIFKFKNGKSCCSKKYRSCPFQANKLGKLRIGKHHTEATKRKIGEKSKQRIIENGAPFHGKHHTAANKQLASDRMKGNIPWNKGKTKENNSSVLSSSIKNSDGRTANFGKTNGMFGNTHTDEVKEQQRLKNLSERKWQGKNNPWFGKDRSGNNSPCFLSAKERSAWEQYSRLVRSLTEKTYRTYLDIINPTNLLRGITKYHLDHIIPIWYGFKNDIDPKLLSLKENLRMLYYTENLKRYKTTITNNEKLLLEQLQQII